MPPVRFLSGPAAAGFALLLWAASAHAACVPARFPPGWLEQQEKDGGRTIEYNVAKPDSFLVERLQADAGIPYASTFPDVPTATAAIEAALKASAAHITLWLGRAKVGQALALEAKAGTPVGRIAVRPVGASNIHPATSLILVLKKLSDDSCVLLNAYPSTGQQQ